MHLPPDYINSTLHYALSNTTLPAHSADNDRAKVSWSIITQIYSPVVSLVTSLTLLQPRETKGNERANQLQDDGA